MTNAECAPPLEKNRRRAIIRRLIETLLCRAFTDRHSLQAANRPAETDAARRTRIFPCGLILNVEMWADRNAMPRTVLSPPMCHRCCRMYRTVSWHEYGIAPAFWRQVQALTAATAGDPGGERHVCNSYPRVARPRGGRFELHGPVFLFQAPCTSSTPQADTIKRDGRQPLATFA